MLCKCSGKHIDIYFILKITYLDYLTSLALPTKTLNKQTWQPSLHGSIGGDSVIASSLVVFAHHLNLLLHGE